MTAPVETTDLRMVEIRESGRKLLVERRRRGDVVLQTDVRCPNSLRLLQGGGLMRRAIRAAFPSAPVEPEPVEEPWWNR